MAIGTKFTSQSSPKTPEIDFKSTYKYIFIASRLLTNNAMICNGLCWLFATKSAFWRILVQNSGLVQNPVCHVTVGGDLASPRTIAKYIFARGGGAGRAMYCSSKSVIIMF